MRGVRAPETLVPEIIFEDANLIVVNKPAGLLSQGDHTSRPSLVDWAKAHFGRPYVGLIHRLDTNTSGIMLIAKRTKAAARLTDALQHDQIRRSYVALVVGTIAASARWEHLLFKNESTNHVRAYAVGDGHAPTGAKLSALSVTPLARGPENTTWVQFVLETGRSHQIRAQAEAMGHGLIGDPKYGGADARAQPQFGLKRPALHSWTIEFQHPVASPDPNTGEKAQPMLHFAAALPADLAALPGAPASATHAQR